MELEEIKTKIMGLEFEYKNRIGVVVEVASYTGGGQMRFDTENQRIFKPIQANIKLQYPDQSTEWIKGVEFTKEDLTDE